MVTKCMLLVARPHPESCWRSVWGSRNTPRPRSPSAGADGRGLRQRERYRAVSPPCPRHNLRVIQRRSATAGGTQGDLAMSTSGQTCIVPSLQYGHLAPRRNSSYGVARGVVLRYRRRASKERVPWPLAGNDNAVETSADGRLTVAPCIVLLPALVLLRTRLNAVATRSGVGCARLRGTRAAEVPDELRPRCKDRHSMVAGLRFG